MAIAEDGVTQTTTNLYVQSSAGTFDREAVKRAVLEKLFYARGKYPGLATETDYYMAVAYCVRDMLLHRWVNTAATYAEAQTRTVAYFSAEYLIGPHLGNNLVNLGIYDDMKAVVEEIGLDFDALLAQEPEPGVPGLVQREGHGCCSGSGG